MRRIPWIFYLFLAVSVSGCGGADKLEAVSGRVLFRGAPLAGGTIVFAPDPHRGGDGPIAVGEIGPDGRYSLRTGAETGVAAGWHRVTVAAAPGKSLPSRYSDPERSGQEREVKPGTANTIDFQLD